MMTEEQAKSLLLKQENVYTRDPQLREPAFAYCEGYKAFLNAAKPSARPWNGRCGRPKRTASSPMTRR